MGMTKARDVAFLVFLYATSMLAFASDPSELQRFCVGTSDPNNAVHVNGHTCKNPAEVTADDFYFKNIKRNDGGGNFHLHVQDVNGTIVDSTNLPGLNTLGASVLRVDFGPGGLTPTHFHPNATEVITILDGTIQAAFVASNKVFAKVLYPGDVFVLPRGLHHFVRNLREEHASLMAGFSSDNPGLAEATPIALGPTPPPA